jgi:transcriptional regulator with XRE-family HTH domain
MKERLKQLRKELNLNQQEFAEKIGINRGTLANYEVGRNEPIDAVVKLICDRFHVNEEWLRTGEGEMFTALSKEDEIMELIEQSMSEESGEIKRRFATAIMKLTPEQIRHCTNWIIDNLLAMPQDDKPAAVDAQEKKK